MKAPETECKWCDTVIPEQPNTPGRPKQFCSKSCRRSWHYGRERFLELYTEEKHRKRQKYWEVIARDQGPERADQLLARTIEREAAQIKRFELDLEPWKPNRRKAPRKAGRGL